MRIVLISGSNSGFGAECAAAFAANGDRVIATARDPSTHPLAGRDGIELRALDVTDGASIDACVSGVLNDHGRIDVLVNNAGIHLLGAIEDMDEAAFRRVLETNFFGAIRLARAVLPSMREHGSGHVISVSSIGARVGRVIDGAYCASKAALEMAMEALRYEVARFGVRVSVVSPGAYRTGIKRRFESKPEHTGDSPYAALQAFRYRKVHESVAGGGDPQEVASAILDISHDPDPPFRHVIGEMAELMDRTLDEADAAGRAEMLTRLSGIDWWLEGRDGPEEGPAGGDPSGDSQS
ncbi:SDR family oxidoreductase [Elongatibacter sediminis]|uniref:SDR family oxidoreductase n=1 Tax=Elongatibacter sediminis TaxID=3119006 RepID=A0AAW9R9A5_9GAMM